MWLVRETCLEEDIAVCLDTLYRHLLSLPAPEHMAMHVEKSIRCPYVHTIVLNFTEVHASFLLFPKDNQQ